MGDFHDLAKRRGYRQVQRTKAHFVGHALPPEVAARFWAKIDVGPEGDCWQWTASTRKGYGRIKIGGDWYSAHRLACEHGIGEPLGDRMACHKCDNPICCNPSHLYAGTARENGLDAHARGQQPKLNQTGEANGNAKLRAETVAEVRRLMAEGKSNMAIGRMFGVTHQTISKIRTGVNWSGV